MSASYRLLRGLLAGLAGAALAGCTSTPEPDAALSPRTGMGLSSPGRADNALVPALYGGNNKANPNCAGQNVSPALAWVRVPDKARSLAILLDDQAGRGGLGVSHWVAYGIAPTLSGLAEGGASAPSPTFTGGKNMIGTDLYFGPCPPRGNAPQHYVFTLIATTLEPGALPAGLNKAELLAALAGKTVGAASLVLRYAH